MQLMSSLIEKTSIPTRELEIVPKSFDDASLQPADTSIGERPCCLQDRCICLWLAKWRYGDNSDLAFVCKEFLLPSERKAFEEDGPSALPATAAKCLVCSRYMHTYVYRLARSDSSFCPSHHIPLQAFGNAIGTVQGKNLPTHCNSTLSKDGYRQDAMLFVDETWAETAAARSPMGTFLWRPVVKFNSSTYRYVKDEKTGMPRILQINVGTEQLFQEPTRPSKEELPDALAKPNA